MKRFLSVVFPLLLLAAVLMASACSVEIRPLWEEDMEKACKNVLPAAVRVQGGGYYGSGSIYEIGKKEIIIVTNSHLIQYLDEDSHVTFFNGAKAPCRVLGSSETADIGFLSVSAGDLSKEERKPLKMIGKSGEAYRKLKKNDSFFIIDIGTDFRKPVCYKGGVVNKEKFLEDYGREMLYGDGAAVPGMSGSGIFDYRGNYLGTLSGATPQFEIAAVPLPAVLEAYRKLALP